MAGRGERGRCVLRRGAGHGRGEEAVLSDFRSTGSTGRGANAVWHSIEQTSATTAKVEAAGQAAGSQDRYRVGQGAPRFYLAMSPELPDPSFAKIVVLTQSEEAREALKLRLRQVVADGLAPEPACECKLVFGPYSPFPVLPRDGPDPDKAS